MATPDPRDRQLLLVVDAPSLLHRNHHARAHTRILDRSGRPAWALHGMLRQIIESIDRFAPDAVIFGLDDRAGSTRRDFYPDYKAGRAEKHPELVDQLERAGALLDALGLATLTPPGLEADDVNASGATWAERNGWNCVIITSDGDAFAHISAHTRVLRLIDGGIHGSPMLNPARLFDMYAVRPANYLAFAALMLVNFVFSLATGSAGLRGGIVGPVSPLAVGISAIAIVLAVFNLILDFDFIEKGVQNGIPQKYAWTAAFGLVVTLIWLYIEFLRILSILRGDD